MPANGPYLVFLTVACIGLLLFLILYVRTHAFVALMITSMALGLGAGLGPQKTLRAIQAGMGDALGFIAIVIGLGAMVGRFLEYSGGSRALADWLLAKFGKDHAPWAVLTTSFLVGLPIFFDVGFIILAPLAWSLARESKRSLLVFGLPIACALTVTHSLVPPHPAPAAAAQLLGADLGKTILLGVAFSVPMVIAGGMLYGPWISRRLFIPVPAIASRASEEAGHKPSATPAVPMVVLMLTLPVLLIFAATVSQMARTPGQTIFAFFGHPFAALLVTALLAMIFFGIRLGLNRDQVTKMATDSLAPLCSLLLITGAGGSFKQVIVDSGVGPYMGDQLVKSALSPLVVAYVISAVMRAAQGSATVAIITAAGIVAPLVKDIPGYTPEMIVMALACGGTCLSHVNDSGFWIVNQYLGMSVPETLKSWTVMKVITSIVGFAFVLAAQALFF